MDSIWSSNKKVNTALNILLLLLSVNFLHYAQLVLPIMCLIIFIDNKGKFKVNNMFTFIILCLFGVSFFAFTISFFGAYAFIGFFMPMAYYVGSNIKEPDENKIKTIIYIVALGMTLHILLNFSCDLIVRGFNCFFRNSHLDFWTWNEYPTTQTSAMYIFIIGIIYYIFVYEKNKRITIATIVMFFIAFIYSIALGRRTPIFLLVLVTVVTYIIDFVFLKNRSRMSKTLLFILFIFMLIGLLIFIIYEMDLFNLRDQLSHLGIVRKFTSLGFYSNRHNLIKQTIELAPYHLFGGMEITKLTIYGPHDLWLNTFDAGGIVPFVFIVLYSIMCLIPTTKLLRSSKFSKEFRLLLFALLLSIVIQFCLEPILTGSSLILLSVVILVTSVESLYLINK